MKRNPARPPSPTPTAFSGISNYRTDSYRSLGSKNAPAAVPQQDSRTLAKIHYEELSRYLAAYLARAPPNSRSAARQKLTRLTRQQFQELSTDVYDELVRRTKNVENEVPFLPVRDDFHPKRNQARQKLATLPTSRFEDLSSDVYFELARRYPEFKEPLPSPASAYDDFPSPDFPNSVQRSRAPREPDEPYKDPSYLGPPGRSRNDDRRRAPEKDYPPPRRSEDAYAGADYASGLSSRRKPSQDATRRSEDRQRELPRRPSVTSDSTATNAQTATATSGVVIPTKSTIAEEEIEIPFGRESAGTTIERGPDGVTDGEPESAGYSSPLGGLSGLTARLRAEDDDEGAASGGNRSGDDYFDKISFGRATSAASDRSNGVSRAAGGRMSVTNDEQEKLRRDYEYKIATMQSRITGLERDLSEADDQAKKLRQGEERVRQLEEELTGLRRRMDEQTTAMRSLQRELDELRDTRTREKEREARRARQDEEELQILRDRCDKLEEERVKREATQADSAVVDQLRTDMQNLLAELSDLSARNDELMVERDSDRSRIRDMDNQLKEYRRKYEQAKTELRGVKATSQLFLQTPQPDDQLPMASDGGILDIHITAFLSAIDSLLTAGRSNAPTKVLSPMKTVVDSVTTIIDDVLAFERRPPRDRSDVDLEALRSLRDRAEATLSNLAAAAKTHATSSGLSPVSLLDAAASHVSATVTDLGKTVCIRKASKAEQEQFARTTASPTAANGSSPTIPHVEDVPLSRKASNPNGRRPDVAALNAVSSIPKPSTFASRALAQSPDTRRRLDSDPPSSGTTSPPLSLDKPSAVGSDGSAQTDSSEDAWSELKPYLEAQTESIVYAIQSVLSGVRSPTPSPTLNENLTQIITIVSSIVAVCNDNVPLASAQQGNEILRELSEHANRLSEVQAMPEVTKESRQIMAKSSFAVANAMKGLMKL